MNFLALQTELLALRFDQTPILQVKNAIARKAYEEVWNAADWQFKKADMAALVLPTSGQPTIPADFARTMQLFDDLGDPIEPLSPEEFEDTYRYYIANGVKGRPESYKVVNRVITLGPTPDQAYNGFASYVKRIGYFNVANAYVPGFMAADTDHPLWPDATGEDYHYVLVPIAQRWLLGTETDYYTRQMITEEAQLALAAMVEALAVVDVGAGNFEYGSDSL